MTTPDKPLDELDALKAALSAEREARQKAEARAAGAEAPVAYYKLQIAKLRREQYGQSCERGRQLLDRLESQLEELAANAAADDAHAAPAEGRQYICSPAASRCGRRFRRICRASAS